MPKNSFKKKKAYQAFCKQQAKKGLINTYDVAGGSARWERIGAVRETSMTRDYKGGHKLA